MDLKALDNLSGWNRKQTNNHPNKSDISDYHTNHLHNKQYYSFYTFKLNSIMLERDDNSRVAKSLATANENKPKCSNQRHRNKGRKPTYLWKITDTQRPAERHPHLHCQPLNEGWGGSWLHPFITQVHCMHLSSPGLAPPSHQVLHHCFRP